MGKGRAREKEGGRSGKTKKNQSKINIKTESLSISVQRCSGYIKKKNKKMKKKNRKHLPTMTMAPNRQTNPLRTAAAPPFPL
jgi:hypothetical protein